MKLARTGMVVGSIGPNGVRRHVELAKYCAWGNHWMTDADEVRHLLGAPTSHGICAKHAADFERDMDEIPFPKRDDFGGAA